MNFTYFNICFSSKLCVLRQISNFKMLGQLRNLIDHLSSLSLDSCQTMDLISPFYHLHILPLLPPTKQSELLLEATLDENVIKIKEARGGYISYSRIAVKK